MAPTAGTHPVAPSRTKCARSGTCGVVKRVSDYPEKKRQRKRRDTSASDASMRFDARRRAVPNGQRRSRTSYTSRCEQKYAGVNETEMQRRNAKCAPYSVCIMRGRPHSNAEIEWRNAFKDLCSIENCYVRTTSPGVHPPRGPRQVQTWCVLYL